ncbi:MAG: type II toxin-antitoxin system VapC family toxin [Candidatus Bathyarchaeota archaeon]
MPIVELDLLIALVNREDGLHEAASKLFEAAAHGRIGKITIATSALMEYELILKSRGYSEEDIATDIRALTSIRNVDEAPINAQVMLTAINLRKKYQLTYFDSLHAATAILHDGAIISTDKAYREIKELKAIDPKKYE